MLCIKKYFFIVRIDNPARRSSKDNGRGELAVGPESKDWNTEELKIQQRQQRPGTLWECINIRNEKNQKIEDEREVVENYQEASF